MKTPFSLTMRQILLAVLLLILGTAAFTLLVFILGQQNGLRLSSTGPAEASPPERTAPALASPTRAVVTFDPAALPRAMTATPKTRAPEQKVFTDATATQLVQEHLAQSGNQAPVQIDRLAFTPEQVNMSGEINSEYALGLAGSVELSGTVAVEENRLRFHLTRLSLDEEQMPELLYASIEAEVNSFFDQTFTGYDVLEVQLAAGEMTVTLLPW
ncbi:MAG: hypothetical protein AB1894_17775 [Chloroflexota bacterium]